MLATRWNPWEELLDMDRQLGALTRSFLGTHRAQNGAATVVPAVDTFTRGDDLVVRAELPGVDADNDVDISLQGNVLCIRGERRRDDRTEQEGYVEFESSYGSFERNIHVPDGVNPEEIRASYDRGILEVVVPNAVKASSPKRIHVTSGDARKELNASATNGG